MSFELEDKYKILFDLIWVAVQKLLRLIADIRAGRVDPNDIDLAELRARVDAINDLPTN
jgi:hypothetical protein